MPDDYPFLDREPVEVRSPSAETWHLLGGLQDAFPSGWVLIGGLMVYLLAAEAGQTPTRVTADADVLVAVKVFANGTIRIAEWLHEWEQRRTTGGRSSLSAAQGITRLRNSSNSGTVNAVSP